LARLAGQAKTLEELIAKLEAEKARIAATPRPKLKPEDRPFATLPPRVAKPFSGARGALPLPARGDLVAGFGVETGEGRSKGISIATRANAQVVAPYDGQVVFADRFRSYGRLLIISHGEGYHSLLAGMQRIDARVGQWVLAGEPVGEMGTGAAGDDGRPVLYVELQHDGKPINPLPWLSAQLGKGKR
ncbi:MAG: peptidase M23, partial [Alphaproteobacteria bacterium]